MQPARTFMKDVKNLLTFKSSSKKLSTKSKERGLPKEFWKKVRQYWAARHEQLEDVRYDNVRRVSQQHCQVAGQCVCKGRGKTEKLMVFALHNAIKAFCPDQSANKALLVDGDVVIRIQSRMAQPENLEEEERNDTSELPTIWYHISDICLSPYRPVYHPLDYEKSSDDGQIVFVDACRHDFPRLCWELASSWDRTLQWEVALYELYAPSTMLAFFIPGKLMVKQLTFETIFWDGAKRRQKRHERRRKGQQPRNKDTVESDTSDEDDSPDEDPGANDTDHENGPGSSATEIAEGEGSSGSCHGFGTSSEEEGGDPAAAASTGREFHGRQPAEVELVTPYGTMRYYSTTKRFAAQCNKHGKACKKERKQNEGANPSQGRPVGYLYAWMKRQHHDTAHQHVHREAEQTLQARQAAREELKQLVGAAALFNKERKQRPGEPEEPIPSP